MVDVSVVRIKLGCCGKVSETELGVLAGVLHTSLQLKQKEGEKENIGAGRRYFASYAVSNEEITLHC